MPLLYIIRLMIRRLLNFYLLDWRDYFSRKYNVILFAVLLLGVYFSLSFISNFLSWAEYREGYVIKDWLLTLISPVDLSVPLFVMTYSSIIIGLVFSFRRPDLALLAMLTTIMIIFFRFLSIYLVPLEAPEGIIPLRDIFLENTVYSGSTLTKDLFFSGHTASVFSLSLIVGLKWIRFYLYLATLAVASMLVVQHVHYTVDVIFAIPFSFLAVSISKMILKQITVFDYSNPYSLRLQHSVKTDSIVLAD